MKNLKPPSDSIPDLHTKIKLDIVQERIRQARHSFNLALFIIAISTCISLGGAGLLLSGKVTEGAVTTAGGLVSTVRCIQFAKDANDRLDRTTHDPTEEDDD